MSSWWETVQGALGGLLVGWVFWRLPVRLQPLRQQWRDRWQDWQESRPKVQREIARIQGAFRLEDRVPNSPPRPFLRERLLNWWDDLDRSTRPRSPEEVAERCYREILAGS